MNKSQQSYLLAHECSSDIDALSPVIWSPEDVRRSEGAPDALVDLLQWVDHYVIRPHPELGRGGPVCPFVPPALKSDAIWMSIAQTTHCDEAEILVLLKKYLEIYEALGPNDSELRELKSLIVAFPCLPRDAAVTLVPRLHGIMKVDVVSRGLMLGEFYEDSLSPGIHNILFFPLRSKIPLFVFRRMVPNDIFFLDRRSDPPSLRAQYLSSYLEWLGSRLSPERVQELALAIVEARNLASIDSA